MAWISDKVPYGSYFCMDFPRNLQNVTVKAALV